MIKGDRLLGKSTLEDLKYEIQEFSDKIEPWHQSGMIKIGWTHGDVVLMGVIGDRLNKIYLYGESSDQGEFNLIAENVFSLFAKIELVPDIELLEFYKIKINDLYYNWDEKYWRIKNDHPA